MPASFSHGAPPPRSARSLSIVRCPQAKPLRTICLCDDLTTTRTHYYQNRTVPCTEPDCEPHQHGIPYRWHSYYVGWNPDTNQQLLIEITADVAEVLANERKRHGTLRGLVITLERPSAKINGAVRATATPWTGPHASVPPQPNVVTALCILWHIPIPAAETFPGRDAQPFVRVDSAKVTAAHKFGDNGETHRP